MGVFLNLIQWFRKRPLQTILLISFLNGLFFFSIVPAWWHYDEPGHFEYAWLAANRSTWPKAGELDNTMRQQLAESMIRYGWYKARGYNIDLSTTQPIWIGAAQTGDQPGYYFIASLPLRLLHNTDIIFQYYSARSISFLMYLLIVFTAWKTIGAILPDNETIQWIATSFIALLPAFTDTMIAVNNDVSAVLASTLFLWSSITLIKRGFSTKRILGLIVTLLLCYFSKSTAWFVFLLAPFVLILTFLRGRLAWLVWSGTAVGIIAIASLLFQWNSPLAWYQEPSQVLPLRIKIVDAPVGAHAFEMDDSGLTNNHSQILQFLSPSEAQSLKGKTITLGAWMWADKAVQATPPYIKFETYDLKYIRTSLAPITLDTKPAFYQIVYKVPSTVTGATVVIQYPANVPTKSKIFVDGITLAVGEHPQAAPVFSDANASQGTWDGQQFKNLIRNGSAEQGSFGIRSSIENKIQKVLAGSGINPALIVMTFQDWKGSGWYYQEALSVLTRTFWTSIAADKVNLPGNYTNDLLFILTIIGVSGAIHLMWTRRKSLHWDIIYILGMTVLIVWALTFTRGTSSLLNNITFAPWARYGYPAILPTALMICAGWLEWLNVLKAKFHFTDYVSNAIVLGWIYGLLIFVYIGVIRSFYAAWWTDWGTLALIFLSQAIAFWLLIKGQALFQHSAS
jgi:hypothetical protein